MIKLKQLTIKNFLSVGNVTQAMKLDDSGLTLVLGENTDANGGMTRNGAGKALSMDARVLTTAGWTRMGDLNVGDHVVTPDGDEAPISGIYPQGALDLYRVVFADGRTVECCLDHLWKVWSRFNGGWSWETVNTRDIISRLNSNKPGNRTYIPLIEPRFTRDVDLPMDPRLLGILLGDGSMSDKVSLSSADYEIVEYFANQLPEGYTLRRHGRYDYNLSYNRENPPETARKHGANPVVNVLKELKLFGKRSWEKFIPSIYKVSSVAQKQALLSGLIDTDGHVGRNGEISFTSTSRVLAADVQELVRSIGGTAKITSRVTQYTSRNGEKVSGRESFKVSIRYRNPKSLMAISRKLERISSDYQYADNLRLEVSSIEFSRKAEAQCIMVDHPDHLYVTDDYIVTHNTTLIQAVSYALYGKPISKIKIPNLVNNINQKGMVVTLGFERDGIEYLVERGKKPDFLRLLVDGKENAPPADEALGENRHTQTEIERIMGLSYTMFQHVVALNTMTEPFLKMRTSDQKEIIEELLGITQISQRAETLKKLIGETKDSIKSHEISVKAITETNNRIKVTIEAAERRADQWRVTHLRKIDDLREDVEHVNAIDFDAELAAFDDLDAYVSKERELTTALDAAQREMSLLDREYKALDNEAKKLLAAANEGVEDQIKRLESDQTRKKTYLERHRQQVITFQNEITSIQSDIENSDSSHCVCCGQSIEGTDHLKAVLINLEAKKADVLSKITKEEIEVSKLRTEINEFDTMISDLRLDNDTKAEELRANAKEMSDAATTMQDAIIDLANEVDRSTTAVRDIGTKPSVTFSSRDEVYRVRQSRDNLLQELSVEENAPNPHDSEITNLQSALQEIDYSALNDFSVLLVHQDFLHKLLSNKDSFIRKKIIDQNLSYLNSRLNHYLDKLGLPHEVTFQSDLNVNITKLGRDFDFEQLSRGEMNRVIMATSWSFRDMWESTNVGCNLLWVDELIDSGLDTQGVESALSILKSMARDRGKNIFLISHRDELQARIDRTLMVRKENDFTELSFDSL